jgi:hypothetical protein
MVPALVAAFPEAKVLWLQRDGRDVVASELQRGGYAPQSALPWRVSKWARWRPRADRIGAATAVQWRSWIRLEKLAWQWDWTHRLIRDDLERLAPDRFRVLQLERLEENLPEVARWLGLRPVDFLVERANRRRDAEDPEPHALGERHPNRVERVEGWTSWSATDRTTFEMRSGDMMDELYPAWRDGGRWAQPAPSCAPEEAPSQDVILRAALARTTVDLWEARSELAVLRHDPRSLALRLAPALRSRVRGRNAG